MDSEESESASPSGRLRGKEVEFSILGCTKVRFTGHLLTRMRQRNIKEGQVLEAIRNPDATGLPTDPGRSRVQKYFPNRRALDVVYEVWDDMLVVVTAFFKVRGRKK